MFSWLRLFKTLNLFRYRFGVWSSLLSATRPRQWTKNSLVVVAALASGDVFDISIWPRVGLAFIIFTLLSCSMYLINDVCDKKIDINHPKKKHRPIASGRMSSRSAVVAALIFSVVGLFATFVLSISSLPIAASYLVLTLLYSFKLKTFAIIEILVVASGFVLRVLFGASVINVPMSIWLGMCIFFGSSMIVIAKRQAELSLHDKQFVRSVVLKYSEKTLRTVEIFVALGLSVTYILWTFLGQEDIYTQRFLLNISCIPFMAGIARFLYVAQNSGIEEPEEFLLSDRIMKILGLIFSIFLTTGIFVNS